MVATSVRHKAKKTGRKKPGANPGGKKNWAIMVLRPVFFTRFFIFARFFEKKRPKNRAKTWRQTRMAKKKPGEKKIAPGFFARFFPYAEHW